MINLSKVSKTYLQGKDKCLVLDNLDLTIKEGEFTAMMGRSGSGKTTALNIIGLLDAQITGDYFLLGKLVSNQSSDELARLRNSHFGFVFQNFSLLATLTIWDNICLPLQYYQADKTTAYKRAKTLMQDMGIFTFAKSYPAQLSGGQQQRAAICRALICQPKVLLADEPTGALDKKNGKILMSLLQKLNQKHGLTIFMITHDQEVASYANKTIYLQEGKLAT